MFAYIKILCNARPVLGLSLSGKSFISRTNKIGPNIEPWGTPERTGLTDDLTFPIVTNCSRPQR